MYLAMVASRLFHSWDSKLVVHRCVIVQRLEKVRHAPLTWLNTQVLVMTDIGIKSWAKKNEERENIFHWRRWWRDEKWKQSTSWRKRNLPKHKIKFFFGFSTVFGVDKYISKSCLIRTKMLSTEFLCGTRRSERAKREMNETNLSHD